MKLNNLLAGLFSLVLAFGMIACQTEVGPAGPAGPAGPQGPPGADGQNGAENCVDCHGSNQLITAKMFQWENSVHALGGHYSYGNRTNCAICHSSQGFLEVAGTGAQETAAPIEDPLPQNCYTCHQIHNTYTADDWALTQTDPVTLWVGGETVDVGKGNLCVSCHQARLRSPAVPVPGTTGTLTLTSSHWGSHYSSQGSIYAGTGGYEVEGDEAYNNSLHLSLTKDDKACAACHMAPVTGGRAAGGHTFRVADEGGAINYNACSECHDDEDELELMVEATQTEVHDLLEKLGDELYIDGIFDADHNFIVPVDVTHDQAGAVWNYFLVEEDQSMGVHNAKYARALLKNSIQSLQ